jgi:hypothetical protein
VAGAWTSPDQRTGPGKRQYEQTTPTGGITVARTGTLTEAGRWSTHDAARLTLTYRIPEQF